MLRHRIKERKSLLKVYADNNNTLTPTSGEVDCEYLQESLRECITKLPENLRSVVMLHDLAELSYEQVGRILGITKATARVYRCKAIQLLAVWMNRKEKNED